MVKPLTIILICITMTALFLAILNDRNLRRSRLAMLLNDCIGQFQDNNVEPEEDEDEGCNPWAWCNT